MITVVSALYIAGGVFPLAAFAWAFWKANRQYQRLEQKLHFMDRIVSRTGAEATPENIKEWLKIYGMEDPEAGHPAEWMYAPEIAQKAVWDELRRPAYMAVAGVLAGTVGSLLSLTL